MNELSGVRKGLPVFVALAIVASMALSTAASARADTAGQGVVDERELAERILAEVERALESVHLNDEAMRRALEASQRAMQRLPRGMGFETLHVLRGCDRYGSEVLDHADELQLSDDQAGQIRAIQRTFRRETIQRQADIEVAEMDLESLRDDPDADLEEIRSVLEQVAALETAEKMSGLYLKRDIRQLLTGEQTEQLDDLHDAGESKALVWVMAGRRFGC